MIDISGVRDALAANLSNVDGLRVSAHVPDVVNPPMALVTVGRGTFIRYDAALSSGAAELSFVVVLFVTRASEGAGQDALDAYVSDGPGSIKAAIESNPTLGTLADWVVVTEARSFGTLTYNGVDYFGCEFLVGVGV